MIRARRRQLTSDFRKAILADPRGIVRLAQLSGFSAYPQLSKLLRARRFSGTTLNQSRLRQLAANIDFSGEVFHG
jgi:hypothetical protein